MLACNTSIKRLMLQQISKIKQIKESIPVHNTSFVLREMKGTKMRSKLKMKMRSKRQKLSLIVVLYYKISAGASIATVFIFANVSS